MRSRPPLTTALALTLALTAIWAPAAFAASHVRPLQRPTIVHVDERGGFDWADAAIGAAAGVALSVLGLGLLLLASARSRPST